MRVNVYNQLMAMQASRRDVMKGAGAAAALAAAGPLALSSAPAYAADSVVAQIMKIPGAGNGSPTSSSATFTSGRLGSTRRCSGSSPRPLSSAMS